MSQGENEYLSPGGEDAVGALAFHAEGGVEAGAEVFLGDDGSELDELGLVVDLLEVGEKLVGDVGRGGGHGLRQLQGELLLGGEEVAGAETVDGRDLGIGGACSAAPGRVAVNSERAAD